MIVFIKRFSSVFLLLLLAGNVSSQQLFSKKSRCFIPFFMLGYPDVTSCFDYVKAAIDAGATIKPLLNDRDNIEGNIDNNSDCDDKINDINEYVNRNYFCNNQNIYITTIHCDIVQHY